MLEQKDINRVLHIVRNPHGFTEDEVRDARLACADMVERFQGAYLNMRAYAEANGLDTVARNCPQPSVNLQTNG